MKKEYQFHHKIIIETKKMDLPVLIYIAKKGCPGCINYEKEWQEVMRQLNGRARFVKFNCYATEHLPPPPVLNEFSDWFPSIVLAPPRSYGKCFNEKGEVAPTYSDDYSMRGMKFNAVKTPRGYEPGGRANTAQNTVNWFNQVVGSIHQIDDWT